MNATNNNTNNEGTQNMKTLKTAGYQTIEAQAERIKELEATLIAHVERIKELEGQLDMALGGPVPIAD